VSEDSLTILEAGRRRRPSGGQTLQALERLRAEPPASPADLARLHEALLFHAAYPETASVHRQSLRLLKSLARDVARRASAGEDLSALDAPEIAGVAGTAVATTFTYDFLRGLAARHPAAVRVDWDAFEGQDRMGATFPRFLPLLEEEALADANVPYREWIGAARGREGELAWILRRFGELPLSPPRSGRLLSLHRPIVCHASAQTFASTLLPIRRTRPQTPCLCPEPAGIR